MLYREIVAVCSQIHTKHINTLCGQNAEWPNVKPIFPVEYIKMKVQYSTVHPRTGHEGPSGEAKV